MLCTRAKPYLNLCTKKKPFCCFCLCAAYNWNLFVVLCDNGLRVTLTELHGMAWHGSHLKYLWIAKKTWTWFLSIVVEEICMVLSIPTSSQSLVHWQLSQHHTVGFSRKSIASIKLMQISPISGFSLFRLGFAVVNCINLRKRSSDLASFGRKALLSYKKPRNLP
jgi:hypothetical protein